MKTFYLVVTLLVTVKGDKNVTTKSPLMQLIYKVAESRDVHEPMILSLSNSDLHALNEFFQPDNETKKENRKVENHHKVVIHKAEVHKEEKPDEGVFKAFFASGKKLFLGRSDKLDEARELWEFDEKITGVTKHGSQLFASVERKFFQNSEIWRANATKSSSWERFVVLDSHSENVRCVVAVEGYLYAGLDDGKVLRCMTDQFNKCEVFRKFEDPIIGIDYDPETKEVYLSTETDAHSCPLSTHQACWRVPVNVGVEKITALKVGLNGLWLGARRGYSFWKDGKWPFTTETWLYKYPIRSSFVWVPFDERFFGKPLDDGDDVSAITSDDRYLYFVSSRGQEIRRCEPKGDYTCEKVASSSIEIKTFVIV